MKFKITFRFILLLLLVIIIVYLSIANCKNNDFLKLKLIDIINMLITLIIAIYIINIQSKHSKFLNNFEYLIKKLQNKIYIDNIDKIITVRNKNIVRQKLQMHISFIRKMKEIILNYKNKTNFNKETRKNIDNIYKYLEEYDELISDNINEINNIYITQKIEKKSNLIELECEKILLNVHL